MRIRLSPIHSDFFFIYLLSSRLCAQSYHKMTCRTSGETARHAVGLLLTPTAVGKDASQRTVRGLFLLTNEKYLQPKWFVDHVWRGLNPARMEITRTRQLVEVRLSDKGGCRQSSCFQKSIQTFNAAWYVLLERARRRQTLSLIRRGWRTAGTTGTLGCLEE